MKLIVLIVLLVTLAKGEVEEDTDVQKESERELDGEENSATLSAAATYENVSSGEEDTKDKDEVGGGKEDVKEDEEPIPTRSAALASTKVKVVCWDYRTMGTYPMEVKEMVKDKDNETESKQSEDGTGDVPEQFQPLVLPLLKVENNTKDEESGKINEMDSESEVVEGEETENVTGAAVEAVPSWAKNQTVEIVNASYLNSEILYQNPLVRTKSSPGNCTLVMFYAPWCHFSAKAAPHFNAVPRAYPSLRVAAIDAQKWRNVNTFFGVLAVPTVIFFHNGKIIAKFNESSFSLQKLADFIEYNSDLKHEERMNVTAKDFEGPLPSAAQKERDWYLLIAWIFLFLTCAHYITKSIIWWRFVEFVRTTWREAEQVQPHHQHEHID